MRRVTFFFICCLAASINSTAQNNDVQTLTKLNRQFLDALVNKDSVSLGKILASDFQLINPGGMKRSRSDNMAMAAAPGQRVNSIVIDSISVRMLTNDVGLVSAWTTNSITSEGKEITLKISYQDVYQKRKNRWYAVSAHVTVLNGN